MLLSPSGFSETCVKTTVGAQFFFINDSAKPQSVKTAVDAPEACPVDPPKKTSKYARSFKKKGSYSIQTGDGKAALTLLVE